MIYGTIRFTSRENVTERHIRLSGIVTRLRNVEAARQEPVQQLKLGGEPLPVLVVSVVDLYVDLLLEGPEDKENVTEKTDSLSYGEGEKYHVHRHYSVLRE